MKNFKLAFGASIGYFIAALFNSILVVLKESYESIHDFLVNVFGHHWLGHGILVLIVFFIFTALGALLYTGEGEEGLINKLNILIISGTVISLLIILGFNLIHFLS